MGKSILSLKQKQLLNFFIQEKIIIQNFFLTGGTALAEFYFQHRLSEDLDFFSEKEINYRNIIILASKTAKKLGATKLEQQSLTGQLTFFFYFDQEIVKVDFSYFPFPHLGKFLKYKNLRISSLEDIAANKIQAIATRKRARDYVDLYFCLKKLNWDIKKMRQNYQLKYDIYLSAEQLMTFFINVLDAQDLPKFLQKTSWKKIQAFFLSLVKKSKKEVLV